MSCCPATHLRLAIPALAAAFLSQRSRHGPAAGDERSQPVSGFDLPAESCASPRRSAQLEDDAAAPSFGRAPERFRRQIVAYNTREAPGTIIIDTPNTYLYYVLGNGRAIRYGIGVGRDGFTWSGMQSVARKQEWPDWHPPAEMIARQPYLPRFMAGGPGNPLGARAMYLGNSLYRIHGTNAPSTIGQRVSSGCIRLHQRRRDRPVQPRVGRRQGRGAAGQRPPHAGRQRRAARAHAGAAARELPRCARAGLARASSRAAERAAACRNTCRNTRGRRSTPARRRRSSTDPARRRRTRNGRGHRASPIRVLAHSARSWNGMRAVLAGPRASRYGAAQSGGRGHENRSDGGRRGRRIFRRTHAGGRPRRGLHRAPRPSRRAAQGRPEDRERARRPASAEGQCHARSEGGRPGRHRAVRGQAVGHRDRGRACEARWSARTPASSPCRTASTATSASRRSSARSTPFPAPPISRPCSAGRA